MISIENAIKAALFSFPAKNVSRGHVPLDAPAGAVYYSIEKFSYSDDSYSATVKIRYFPHGEPSSMDGEDIFGFVGIIKIGSVEYIAEKYECRIYGRYVDVTVEYSFDEEAFGDALTGGVENEFYPGDTSDDSSSGAEFSSDGIMMKTISVSIVTEAAE